jgi:hypothetical protein
MFMLVFLYTRMSLSLRESNDVQQRSPAGVHGNRLASSRGPLLNIIALPEA